MPASAPPSDDLDSLAQVLIDGLLAVEAALTARKVGPQLKTLLRNADTASLTGKRLAGELRRSRRSTPAEPTDGCRTAEEYAPLMALILGEVCPFCRGICDPPRNLLGEIVERPAHVDVQELCQRYWAERSNKPH
ncbi:hypothetical protein SAMN04488020_105152 [Palleronia marisminoris]|uniref:Uncharacterized protein n=1 Tax=Palleronia marisminoris TaxID=315423 RepID=A0A1Y5STD9_9RHOB|nr:hypothetical protein SAMN04488020_105152 [Palleronia marisminoris]SLN47419.1 hypothetical protein PAM7066_02097 [Palleronia marisminoris]